MEKILIVDDVPINRELLKNIFEGKYDITEAEDGDKAIEMLKAAGKQFSLVLLDLIMPKVSGLEVLAFMQESGLIQRLPVIVITGEATTDSDLKSYQYGASDVIYKPYIPAIVVQRAKNLIDLYAQKRRAEDIANPNAYHLSVKADTLSSICQFLAITLASVAEYKDITSGLHVKRVVAGTAIELMALNRLYPEKYNFSEDDIQLISGAASLHDIGMVGIPDAILMKDKKLKKSEIEMMRVHPTIGCKLLERCNMQDANFYKYVYDICKMHHERIDGSGYPSQLKEDEIPIWAQVAGLIDAYTALLEARNWRAAFDEETALSMIKEGKCGAFAPELIAALEASKDDFNRAMIRAQEVL